MIICFDYYTAKYFKCDENRVTEAVNKMNKLLKSRKEKGKPVNIIAAALIFYDVLEMPHMSDVYYDFVIRKLYNGTIVDTLYVVPFKDEPSKSTVYSIEWG